MSLQVTKEISIDVSNHRYISIDAKQYDRNLRYILITCYNQGELLPINKSTHFASIRYSKPDNYGVFNACEITKDGKILVELTEQMLAVVGRCYADVVIHENVELSINITHNANSAKIDYSPDSGIVSTMTFVVDVYEAAFDNEEIESSYEYNKLNDLIVKAENTYEVVMESCNNSKIEAAKSEDAAKKSADSAAGNAQTASEKAAEASQSATDAGESASKASQSASDAGESAESAAGNAQTAMREAESAAESATAAEKSVDSASGSAKAAQSYAVGGTDFRTNENADNARFYYTQITELNNTITNSITGGLIPMGTITFSELATTSKEVGYMYNISTDFTTDETFREGAGNTYEAGTLVYCAYDGKWDCLVGMTISIANINEVKAELGI